VDSALIISPYKTALDVPTPTNIDIIPKDFGHWTIDAMNVTSISTFMVCPSYEWPHGELFFDIRKCIMTRGRNSGEEGFGLPKRLLRGRKVPIILFQLWELITSQLGWTSSFVELIFAQAALVVDSIFMRQCKTRSEHQILFTLEFTFGGFWEIENTDMGACTETIDNKVYSSPPLERVEVGYLKFAAATV